MLSSFESVLKETLSRICDGRSKRFQMVLGNNEEPLSLDLSCKTFGLTDTTHFFSRVYSERLSVLPEQKGRRKKAIFSPANDSSFSSISLNIKKLVICVLHLHELNIFCLF